MSNEPRFTSAYAYPYHWIPFEGRGGWRPARVLSWGLEYLVVLRAVREIVVSLEPRKVLDLGCGDGRLAHELLSAGVPRGGRRGPRRPGDRVRPGGSERRLRCLLTNRVWTLQHPGLVRALTSRFERAASGATVRNAAHVLALLVRRDEPA